MRDPRAADWNLMEFGDLSTKNSDMTLAMIGIQGGYTVMKYCNQQCRVWVCENGWAALMEQRRVLKHNFGGSPTFRQARISQNPLT